MVSDRLAPPQPNEVQVDVAAFGLNFADLFAIWGLYSATPKGMFTPGLEYAGTITKVGSDVKGVSIGDRVMGITKFGGYTDRLNIDYRYVVTLPMDWTMQEGAAYLVQVLTAYYALVSLGNLQAGQNVLIHSGAGGVGIFANRIAKNMGAFTIGTTASAAKLPLMSKEGYDRTLVRSNEFTQDVLQALEGKPLHLIMECIGGRVLRKGLNLLSAEGRMIVYGSAHFASSGDRPNYLRLMWNYLLRPKIDPLELPRYNRSVMGFNLIWLYDEVEKMHTILNALTHFDLGKPHIGQEFEMNELTSALRLFQSGRTTGKVVLTTG